MRTLKVLAPLFLLVTLFAYITPNANAADPGNRDSFITFSAPVEIPGMVLTPGTYEFKLVDFDNLGYLVEIRNAKGQFLTTVYALPTYRTQVKDSTVVTFTRRGDNLPQALKAWYYPDETDGVLFVYPKVKEVSVNPTATQ